MGSARRANAAEPGPDSRPEPPGTDARWVLLAGEDDLCFLPEPGPHLRLPAGDQARGHALHLIPSYGHLDVFVGARAAEDPFPIILEELAASWAWPTPVQDPCPSKGVNRASQHP